MPHTTSDSNRLYFLNQHLEGKPNSLIAGCMFMDASEGYIKAKRLLGKVYGDPYKVSMAYKDKLTKWSQVRGDNSESLQEYALYLMKCNHTMQSLANLHVLNDSPNLQRVISKLPVYIQNKWLDHVIKLRKQGVCVCFTTLVEFVQNAAEAAMDPVFSREALGKECVFSKAKANHGSSQTKQTSLAVTVQPSNSANQYTRKCKLCSGHHDIEECLQFLHRLLVSDVQYVTDCITVESIRKYFELDSSERDLGSVPDERGLSFEDIRFVKRCKDDIEFRDGHFQLPMPFRDLNVNIPNIKKQAVSRAK
ncbi:uncharacterized protein [Palaemon carinicauda]|uniref:uncharacterized protein n=1 Tax=Palaemon carinicauda TaxID=392227 RepID=UPI0035B6539B